ncbi:MAG: VanZ family protein [Burkholderiaceae bacterium]
MTAKKTSAWPLAWVSSALIVYASLYPFDNWRNQGLFPWEFLTAPWPKYWTWFDVVTNIAGYVPLGFWLTLGAIRSGFRGPIVVLHIFLMLMLSLAMEGLQTYLPMRFPSLTDFLLNTLGGLLGTGLAAAGEKMGWLSRWSTFRSQWFSEEASIPLVLILIWPFALLFPVSVPFGLGQIQERLETAFGEWLRDTPFLEWLPFRDVELEPMVPLVELMCVALGLIIPCLLLMAVTKSWRRRLISNLVLIVMGVFVSALTSGLTFGPTHAWAWVDQATWIAIYMGFILAMLFIFAPSRTCWTFLFLFLMLQLFMLNQAPESVYLGQTLQNWEQGRFIRFNGLAQWLGWLWPYAVLVITLVKLAIHSKQSSLST